MNDPAADPRLLQGIACFNRRAFFEAHEVWEEIWREVRGPSRDFYKGLIQAAVCLYRFENGNLHGARTLFRGGSRYLQPYRPTCLGVDVGRLLADWERCCRPLVANGDSVQQARLDPDLLPVIAAPPSETPPSAKGAEGIGSEEGRSR
jgi:predicted metal-dependent hydrolase